MEKEVRSAHQAAVVAEAAVMSELTGLTLNRVASVQDRSAGQAVFVLDYHLQYVVISRPAADPGPLAIATSQYAATVGPCVPSPSLMRR